MAETEVISASIDPDLKRHAEGIFEGFGTTTSQAITLSIWTELNYNSTCLQQAGREDAENAEKT